MKQWPIIVSLICGLGMSTVLQAKQDHHHDGLPPGLQKKVARGEPLPPGWQKKLSRGDRLDQDIYDRGQVVYHDRKDGLLTIRVEGKLIRLMEHTHEIVDILDSI